MESVVRRPPLKSKNDDDRLLPLINVVFLLLIFFMMAGRLSTSDPLEVEPPRSESAVPPPSPEIEVLAAADGRLALDGQIVSETELLVAMQQRLSQAPAPDLRLRADGELAAGRAIRLMDSLRRAGAGKLYLVTVPARR